MSMRVADRLLFLDFDGVLHPASARASERFSRFAVLEEALSAAAACEIVISSSWRHHHPFADLLALFPASIRPLVVGTTGEPCHGRWPRHQEIVAFVRQRCPAARWRALDDSWNEFPPGCRELIVCNPNKGIDLPQATAVRHWLRRGG